MKNSLILAILLLTAGLACTKAEKPPQQEQTAEDSEKTTVYSKIFIELDMDVVTSSKAGDEIPVSLMDGSTYSLLIQRKEEVMPGISNISAFVNNSETGQAVLILRDGKLAGSVTMFSDGVNYELGFDEESERHYIQQVDKSKKDILPGGEPLEAPRKN